MGLLLIEVERVKIKVSGTMEIKVMRNATGRFSQDFSVYDVIGSFCTRFGTISAANVTT